jgi:mono/diheme cytochrome c family protein
VVLRQVVLFTFVSFVAVRGFSQTDWPTYGHDPGGLRYSPLKQIDPTNVAKLKVAWVYHMKPSNAFETMTAASSAGRHGQAVGTPDGQQKSAPQDEVSLPQGIGRDATKGVCSACHGTNIFAQERHTLEEWGSIVDNMVSKGLEAPDDELDEIRDYLAVSFPRQASPPHDAAAQSMAKGVIPRRRAGHILSSEMTPIVAGGLMYLSSPYHRIVALDPVTGREVWSYITPGSGLPSLRGVEYWPGDGVHPPEVLCGTRDGKLIALLARTG